MSGNAPVITGYRTLSQDEINAVNYTKDIGRIFLKLFSDLDDQHNNPDCEVELDRRWIAIARTHFQQGLMAATRAITRPKGF
jgi:hypothetical protein